jgi:hypothetical protein
MKPVMGKSGERRICQYMNLEIVYEIVMNQVDKLHLWHQDLYYTHAQFDLVIKLDEYFIQRERYADHLSLLACL